MPLVLTNQSPPMLRNSIIAQDMSSIAFLNVRLRRSLRPAERERERARESETGFATLLDESHGHCRIRLPDQHRLSAPSRKDAGHHETRHRLYRRRPSAIPTFVLF